MNDVGLDLLASIWSCAHHKLADLLYDVVSSQVIFSVKELGRRTGTRPVTSCRAAQVLFLQSKSMSLTVR